MRVCDSKFDPFQPHLEERTRAGVKRTSDAARTAGAERYDDLRPSRQASAGELGGIEGHLEREGRGRRFWAFTFTLGCSRRMMAEYAPDARRSLSSVAAAGDGRLKRPFSTGRIGP